MVDVQSSPFERANKLRSSFSSPAAQEGWAIPKPQHKDHDDGFRPFQSPEAVKGFLLHAYRPASLPLANDKEAEKEEACEATETQRDELSARMSPVETLQWPEGSSGARSIVGSPSRLQRTDIPLTRFLPPRSSASFRHASVTIPQNGSRSDLELSARSASAPAFYEALQVEELWASTPVNTGFNPFANVADIEGIFGTSY